jgi:hypothetical protein
MKGKCVSGCSIGHVIILMEMGGQALLTTVQTDVRMNSTAAWVRYVPFASLRRYEPGQVPRVLLSGPQTWPRPERIVEVYAGGSSPRLATPAWRRNNPHNSPLNLDIYPWSVSIHAIAKFAR